MHRRTFSLALPFAALAACAAPRDAVPAPNSTLTVTRHGDRDGSNLNARGRARAAALVDALAGMPLDRVHPPGLQRNIDTASPLATARGLMIDRLPQERPAARLAQSAAGRSVVWVGNKGNIAAIWEDLGLAGAAPLDYGDLAIIRSDATGTVTVERRRYGPA